MENVPDFLIAMLKEQYGEELSNKILEGYKKERYTTLRANTLKTNVEEIEDILKDNKIDFEKVSWSDEAFIIKNVSEQEIQKLEIYEQGKIYMQSLSSMLPPIILSPKENTDILDMCAAPRRKNM